MSTVADDIKLILKFQALIALAPKYKRATRIFKKQKKYGGLLFTLYTLWLFTAVFLKYHYVFTINPEDVILYGIPSVLTAMANLIIVWKNNLSSAQDFQVIFDNFNAIDSNWRMRPGRIKHAIMDFTLITLLSLAMSVYGVYKWCILDGPFHFYVYFIHDKVHLYLTFIVVMFQRYILRSVEVRSAILNETIERAEFDCFGVSRVRKTKQAEMRVMKMIKIHGDICDAADAFNGLFGWNVLFTMVQILVGIVAMINLILYYFTNWLHLFVPILWNIYITAQGVLLTRECEHVSNECEKTAPICFKMAQRFGANTILRDKLLLLANQAVSRAPRFSAAGFFKVDYYMIFIFVNIITTYVIVLIQFKS